MATYMPSARAVRSNRTSSSTWRWGQLTPRWRLVLTARSTRRTREHYSLSETETVGCFDLEPSALRTGFLKTRELDETFCRLWIADDKAKKSRETQLYYCSRGKPQYQGRVSS